MRLLIVVIILVLALGAEVWRRRARLRSRPAPPGFVPTEEIVTDPTTGIRQRVYFNPQTGQRHYVTLERAAHKEGD